MLPSRMLPHVWGEENLQTFIYATAQHEPDLAHCAEFKREVLAATKGGTASSPETRSCRKDIPTSAPPTADLEAAQNGAFSFDRHRAQRQDNGEG